MLVCPENIKTLTNKHIVEYKIFDTDNKLVTCRKSIKGIIKDNCDDSDKISLVTFASDVQVTISHGQKLGREREMLATVEKLKTRGETKFHSAVLKGIQTLLADDDLDFDLTSK